MDRPMAGAGGGSTTAGEAMVVDQLVVGDMLLITVIIFPEHLIFQFQPSRRAFNTLNYNVFPN